jgi:hypothetical protein
MNNVLAATWILSANSMINAINNQSVSSCITRANAVRLVFSRSPPASQAETRYLFQ